MCDNSASRCTGWIFKVSDSSVFGSMNGSKRGPNKLLARHKLTAFSLCLIFSFGMVYHHVFPFSAVQMQAGVPAVDTGQMIWNLWFVNESVSHGHNPYLTNLVFYPVGANLSHHTIAAGYFPVTFIVKILVRGDPKYPIYAYHLVILLGFTLTLYFTYLLLRGWNFSVWAAIIPAIAFAFSAFFKEHALHINQLAAFSIPLCALCLTRVYRKPSWLNAIAGAVVFGYTIYLTEFALYIYVTCALLLLMLLASGQHRRDVQEKFRQIGWSRFLVAGALFLIIVAPFSYYWATD